MVYEIGNYYSADDGSQRCDDLGYESKFSMDSGGRYSLPYFSLSIMLRLKHVPYPKNNKNGWIPLTSMLVRT